MKTSTELARVAGRLRAPLALLGAVFLLWGCATSPEQYMEMGDDKIDKALNELVDVEVDLENGNADKAEKAFNKALKYFDDGVVDYAKAATTPDQKDAVDNLQKGLKKIEQCVKDLEKNDVDAAARNYDEAQQYFDLAGAELWEAG